VRDRKFVDINNNEIELKNDTDDVVSNIEILKGVLLGNEMKMEQNKLLEITSEKIDTIHETLIRNT
jgi:hypothetical protein